VRPYSRIEKGQHKAFFIIEEAWAPPTRGQLWLGGAKRETEASHNIISEKHVEKRADEEAESEE